MLTTSSSCSIGGLSPAMAWCTRSTYAVSSVSSGDPFTTTAGGVVSRLAVCLSGGLSCGLVDGLVGGVVDRLTGWTVNVLAGGLAGESLLAGGPTGGLACGLAVGAVDGLDGGTAG